MNKTTLVKHYKLVIVMLFAFVVISCGGGNLNDVNDKSPDIKIDNPNNPELDTQGNYTGKIVIDLVAKPTINYNEAVGTTNIVLQFIPRTENNLPLTPDQIEVELRINDRAIDVESRLNSSAQELAYNVHYSLVLDTSYSMKVSQSFQPMLQAAQRSVQTGQELWKNRPGDFTFQTSWFDSYIYYAVNNINRNWSPLDITTIPEPLEGAFTKLYAAIDYTLDELAKNQLNEEDTANNFQNVMLVFSDGKDNYSQFDNSSFSAENPGSLVTSNGAEYIKSGRVNTALSTILNKMSTIDNLTVHVIGLGNAIDTQNLSSIAEAGNGLLFQNPETEEVVNLFDRVTREFTTLQSQGVNAPLLPGTHKFSLVVKSKAGEEATEYNFNFKTGDATAAIIENE